MIDERTAQLIQAGIDGELDDAGRAELEAVLEQSEEARRHHSELKRLSEFLEAIPEQEPPADLHARITGAIDLPARSIMRSLFRFNQMPVFVRYGFAAAAGLVLAVAVYEGRDELQTPDDLSSMVGTIMRGGPHGASRVLDTYSFRDAGVTGEVTFERRDGSYVLEFELDSAEMVQFAVDLSGLGLEMGAVVQLDSQLEKMEVTRDSLRGTGAGPQKFAVLFNRAGDTDTGIRPRIGLEFSRQGQVIQTGWLEPDW